MHQYDYDNIKARFEEMEYRIKILENGLSKFVYTFNNIPTPTIKCLNEEVENKTMISCPCMKCTPYTLSGVSL